MYIADSHQEYTCNLRITTCVYDMFVHETWIIGQTRGCIRRANSRTRVPSVYTWESTCSNHSLARTCSKWFLCSFV